MFVWSVGSVGSVGFIEFIGSVGLTLTCILLLGYCVIVLLDLLSFLGLSGSWSFNIFLPLALTLT